MPTASRSSLLPALALVVGGGLLLGAATSLLQTVLPPALNSFANSSGGWSMLVFALVRLALVRPVAGAVLGLLSFFAMLEGYDLVTGWRGFGWSPPFSDPFWLLAVPAGPILGAAAALTLHGTTAWRVLAVAPLSGVLIGEGVWALSAVADTTSPVYWWLEIVLGVAFLGLAILRRKPGLPVVLASLAITAAAAVCFDVVYSLF
ncbi:DUF6518 family protein [Rathayibacter sp. VKM Ac-2630]|uniref:DUF6518 family protein n=1 Tax=Rathayibacter sp. VKM Ac-2630 TaxID=1938617 RepID=UPI00098178F1|nr:DUF6518 family protein [Rathayibacter sp. VKM Ac-2630]OOB90533.1 hypothetical protein B0T42_11010 [Rathayibacter sp. VKM Ac-2630]